MNKIQATKIVSIPNLLTALGLIAILCSFITNAGFGAIVVIILCWSLIYVFFLRLELYLAAIFGFITYFVLNITIYVLGLLLSIDITQLILIGAHIITLSTVGVALYVSSRRQLNSLSNLTKLTPAGIISVFTLVAVIYITLLPFINTGGLTSLKYLSIGEDNISHFALHNSVIKNRSFLYNVTAKEAGVNNNLKSYPHGYHANLAANTILVYGNNPDIRETTKSHILQISLFNALLASILVYCATNTLLRYKKTSAPRFLLASTVAVLITYFVSLGSLLYSFTYGFHTQIASCVFLLFLLATTTRNSIQQENSNNRNWIIGIALVLSILATAYTWYFMLPIVAIFGLVWLVSSWKFIVSNRLFAAFAGVITSTLSLIPIAYDTFRPHDSSSILLSGAIWQVQSISHILIAFLLSIFAVTFFYFRKKGREIIFGKYLAVLLLSSALFSAALALYMLVKIDRLEYYFYKSEYTVLVLSVVTVGYSIGAILDNTRTAISKNMRILISLLVLTFSVVLCVIINPISYTRQYVNGTLPTPLYSQYLDVASNNKGTLYIIKPACRSFQNYITQRWMQAVVLDESKEQTSMILNHIYIGPSSLSDYEKRVLEPKVDGLESISCDP